MKTIEVTGTARTSTGKNANKKVRAQDMVPAVVYGQGEPANVALDYQSIKKALYSPETYIVALNVDGNSSKTIIREAQYHPVTDNILHVDFLRITDEDQVEVALPIRLTGNAVGLLAGGKLVPLMRRLKVRGLPSELPDAVEVDITHLELGKTIRVGDLDEENLEITANPSSGIAIIEIPRAVKTGEVEGEEGMEGEEGEEGAEGGEE